MQIPKEVITALIALAGVLVSVIIALITSRRTINVEINKLRFQLKGAYVGELLKKRIEVYPVLYSILTTFVFKIQSLELTPDTILTLHKNLRTWDADNAIFLSHSSVKHIIELQNHLALMTFNPMNLTKAIETRKLESETLSLIGKLQLALRGDLGIYGFDFSSDEAEGQPVTPETWHK